jgi:outer membrane protein, multidrug efflux system
MLFKIPYRSPIRNSADFAPRSSLALGLLIALSACSQQPAKLPPSNENPSATITGTSPELSSKAATITATQVAFNQNAPVFAPTDNPAPVDSNTANTPSKEVTEALAGWQAFGSNGLNQLLVQGFSQSPDIAASRARLEQARLQYGIARASLWPSLSLSASSGKSSSEPDGGTKQTQQSSRAGVNANYDLDIFGGNRAGRRAAAASYEASKFEEQNARLELSLAIASAWFNHLAFNERYNTQTHNLAIAQRILQLVEARYRAGAVSGADLSLQRANVLSQEAALLPLQSQRLQNLNALAVLLGQTPQTFAAQAEPLAEPLSLLNIPSPSAHWPAQVLAQRPDIAALEATLDAAAANISQTRAALFPQLGLSAATSLSSSELFSLNPATQSINWSLSLAQTLFNGGANYKQYRLTQSRRAELLEIYRKTVLTALAQTQTALSQTSLNAQQEEQQHKLVAEAEQGLNLTQARYRAGRGDLQSMLDAQRSLFQAQDSLLQKRQARLLGVLDMVQALGGWPKEG